MNKLLFSDICTLIAVAARSRAWVGGRFLPGVASSNIATGMDVCVVNVADVSATGRSLVQGIVLRMGNV